MTVANGLTIQPSPSGLTNQLPGLLGHFDVETRKHINVFQATIATAVLDGRLMERNAKFTGLSAKALVCGTSGTTTVKAYKVAKDAVASAKVELATLDIANDAADGLNVAGTLSVVAGALDLVIGDLVYLEVTAAPGSGTSLFVSASYENKAT